MQVFLALSLRILSGWGNLNKLTFIRNSLWVFWAKQNIVFHHEWMEFKLDFQSIGTSHEFHEQLIHVVGGGLVGGRYDFSESLSPTWVFGLRLANLWHYAANVTEYRLPLAIRNVIEWWLKIGLKFLSCWWSQHSISSPTDFQSRAGKL